MYKKIPQQVWLWYCIALVVVVLDQLSKMWISNHLNYNEPLEFTGFFNFTLLHNHGAAFSFLSNAGGWQRWFFAFIAVAISIVLVIWIARVVENNKSEAFALTFILGGALGNLVDRVTLGHVVDFIVVHYKGYFFPAFNLADSAITLGALILVADMFLTKEIKSNA
jgi:signal peptidase II